MQDNLWVSYIQLPQERSESSTQAESGICLANLAVSNVAEVTTNQAFSWFSHSFSASAKQRSNCALLS